MARTRADRRAALTVEELPYLDALDGARIVAGLAGARNVVHSVRIIDQFDQLHQTPAGCALLLTGDRSGWVVEMALRFAWERAAACVLAPDDQEVLDATHRLADRLRIPLVLVRLDEPISTAVALELAVSAPRLSRATVVAELADELAHTPRKPRPVVGLLNARLPGTATCLLTADGGVLAGRTAAAEHAAGVRDTAPAVHATDAGRLVVHPITGPAGTVDMRLVASMSGAVDAWADTVATALSMAAGTLAGWMAAERLTAERDARLRGTMLTELLAGSEATGEQIATQVARLGWQLDGWHTGIHLAVADPTDQETLVARTPAVAAQLAEARLPGVLVERTDGWSVWLDHSEKPSHRTTARIVGRVGDLLAERPAGLAMSAGVGPPGDGLAGLRTSLALAQEAALLAVATGPGCLEHADNLGVRRLLLTPLGSEAFRALAERLLAPVRDHDDGVLLEALAEYLDQMGSVTAVAKALGVHRNTVTNRVERACALLGVDVTDAEQRLATHLACHALRPRTRPDQGRWVSR